MKDFSNASFSPDIIKIMTLALEGAVATPVGALIRQRFDAPLPRSILCVGIGLLGAMSITARKRAKNK
jgi:hypothetical protein